MPSRVSMLAYACVTTVAVVGLGIAFHPVDQTPGDARLTAAQVAEPRGVQRPATDPSMASTVLPVPDIPVPQDVAREVTIKG